jgi:D-mannonate dehydratase
MALKYLQFHFPLYMLSVGTLKSAVYEVRDEHAWPISTLMKVTESISDKSFRVNPLKPLPVREEFTEFCHCESFQTCA